MSLPTAWQIPGYMRGVLAGQLHLAVCFADQSGIHFPDN